MPFIADTFHLKPEPTPSNCIFDQEKLECCREYLVKSFQWAFTQEGEAFWADIASRLTRIAYEGK